MKGPKGLAVDTVYKMQDILNKVYDDTNGSLKTTDSGTVAVANDPRGGSGLYDNYGRTRLSATAVDQT